MEQTTGVVSGPIEIEIRQSAEQTLWARGNMAKVGTYTRSALGQVSDASVAVAIAISATADLIPLVTRSGVKQLAPLQAILRSLTEVLEHLVNANRAASGLYTPLHEIGYLGRPAPHPAREWEQLKWLVHPAKKAGLVAAVCDSHELAQQVAELQEQATGTAHVVSETEPIDSMRVDTTN